MKVIKAKPRYWRSGGLLLVAAIVAGTSAIAWQPHRALERGMRCGDRALAASSAVTSPQEYTVHRSIATTIFWAGEGASADNAYISNVPSAWSDDWVKDFGGVDSPDRRDGYLPQGFTPKENPFYFALPFSDYQNGQPKSDLSMVPWHEGRLEPGASALKNRWIKITCGSKVAYAQWEDVGPTEEHDGAYVFGTSAPRFRRAGLDVSPATATYLGLNGRGYTSWQFVDEKDVPDGPWRERITTSGPHW